MDKRNFINKKSLKELIADQIEVLKMTREARFELIARLNLLVESIICDGCKLWPKMAALDDRKTVSIKDIMDYFETREGVFFGED